MEVVDGVARVRLSTRTLDLGALLEPFRTGESTGLSETERDYVDSVGNGNGLYDLGDLARYLNEHPSVIARGGGS